MNRNVSAIRRLGWALACGMIAFAISAQAKKPVEPPPPEPPVDAGVIYAAVEGDIVAISPDGSGEQYLFTIPDGVSQSDVVPSRLTHNGERWFVSWQLADGWYLDGENVRVRLIATRESGDTVELHNDVLLQPSMAPTPSLRWMPGDTAVSWLAMRWEGGEVVEWGIYSLDLAFTPDGSVVAGAPALVDWTSGLFELWYEPPGGPWKAGYYLFVSDYDWSPDGAAIVFSSYSETTGRQLYAADDTGYVRPLTNDADTYPEMVRWSPDGTQILFQLNSAHQIDVISPDGSGRRTLVATRRTDYREQVFLPMWSPASTHVVYCHYTAGRRLLWHKDALHIIGADGTGDTALTGTYTLVHPLGWRAE